MLSSSFDFLVLFFCLWLIIVPARMRRDASSTLHAASRTYHIALDQEKKISLMH
jgi:hypothetical protein